MAAILVLMPFLLASAAVLASSASSEVYTHIDASSSHGSSVHIEITTEQNGVVHTKTIDKAAPPGVPVVVATSTGASVTSITQHPVRASAAVTATVAASATATTLAAASSTARISIWEGWSRAFSRWWGSVRAWW